MEKNDSKDNDDTKAFLAKIVKLQTQDKPKTQFEASKSQFPQKEKDTALLDYYETQLRAKETQNLKRNQIIDERSMSSTGTMLNPLQNRIIPKINDGKPIANSKMDREFGNFGKSFQDNRYFPKNSSMDTIGEFKKSQNKFTGQAPRPKIDPKQSEKIMVDSVFSRIRKDEEEARGYNHHLSRRTSSISPCLGDRRGLDCKEQIVLRQSDHKERMTNNAGNLNGPNEQNRRSNNSMNASREERRLDYLLQEHYSLLVSFGDLTNPSNSSIAETEAIKKLIKDEDAYSKSVHCRINRLYYELGLLCCEMLVAKIESKYEGGVRNGEKLRGIFKSGISEKNIYKLWELKNIVILNPLVWESQATGLKYLLVKYFLFL